MGINQSGQATPETKVAKNTGKQNKQKFRIVAESSDFMISDVWAKNSSEAWEIARSFDINAFRKSTDECNLKTVFKVDEAIEKNEPFCPVN